MVFSSLASPSIFDKRYRKMVKRNGGVQEPEFKFIRLIVRVFVTPAGLFIMGWTAYSHLHWISPIIGSAIFGRDTVLAFNGMFGYIFDHIGYTQHLLWLQIHAVSFVQIWSILETKEPICMVIVTSADISLNYTKLSSLLGYIYI